MEMRAHLHRSLSVKSVAKRERGEERMMEGAYLNRTVTGVCYAQSYSFTTRIDHDVILSNH